MPVKKQNLKNHKQTFCLPLSKQWGSLRGQRSGQQAQSQGHRDAPVWLKNTPKWRRNCFKIVGFLSSSSLWKMWLGRKRLVKCHSSWLKPNMIMKWENCICLCSPTMVTESKASKTAALLFPLKRNGSLIPPWRYWLLPFLMLSSFCHIFFSFLNSLPY